MCIVIYIKKNEKVYLVKNRDRIYKPTIQIIHEIIHGVEIAYIQDMQSLWVEGINEYGFGLLNTTMNNLYDEEVGLFKNEELKKISKDIYLSILIQKKPNQMMEKIYSSKFLDNPAFEGHTILAGSTEDKNFAVHFESKKNYESRLESIESKDYYSVTNHGILLSNFKDIKKEILLSSITRKTLLDLEIKDKMKNIKSIFDIKSLLNQNYSQLENDLNIYKDKIYENNKVCTTGQIGLNLTDKILSYSYDINNCNFIGIETKLPEFYKPKIKIMVQPVIKNKIDSILNEKIDFILSEIKQNKYIA